MPPTANLTGPPTPGLSSLQQELEARIRCYRETVIRGQYVTRPGWDKGWTAIENAPFADTQQPDSKQQRVSASVCDILHYRKPQAMPCKDLGRYAVLPLTKDESMFLRIARLETVARQPERQQEVFGWVTPASNDTAGQRAFAMRQAAYWKGPDPNVPPAVASFGESLEEVHSLQDTADFHANYLLRLIYLYGETPPHLRTGRAGWRPGGRFARDVNFPEQAEALVRTSLLEFKYWLDDPFYADEPGGAGLRQWRANRATQAKRLDKKTTPAEDPENDAYKTEMTFWSENHQALFATAEYLAGQLWPDAIFRVGNSFRMEGADKSRPTDITGWQRMEKAKPRVLRWLNDRMRFGFSEWNSPGYYDEDFTAVFNLADFCLDEEIQTRACIVLDLMIFDLARFTHRGSFGVSAGRCYFESKNCGYDQSVGDLIELLFGTRDGIIVEASSTCAGALASSTGYRVPDALMAVGQDPDRTFVDRSRVSMNPSEAADYQVGFDSDADVMFWWSRNGYFAKQVIVASLEHALRYHLMKTSPFVDVFPKLVKIAQLGSDVKDLNLSARIDPEVLSKIADLGSVAIEGAVLSRANLYTYRSPAATLSSVQNFHSGQIAFQVQSCQATLSLGADVWTTYPAADDVLKLSGKHDGPNWWTGSATSPRVVQMNHAAIIAYKPNDLQLLLFGHRTHAWLPKAAFDQGSVQQRAGNCNMDEGLWTFGKVGDGYVGLFSAQKPQWTTAGLWADKELIAAGARNFFILQVGGAAEFGSYQKFVDSVSGARIHVAGVSLITPVEVTGTVSGLISGAVGGAEVAGIPGAILGGVGGALLGTKATTQNFECSYDIPGGDRLELLYDEGKVLYAGREFSDDGFPRFENPYIKCDRVEWRQGFYTIKHGAYSLTHDYRAVRNDEPSSHVVRGLDGRGSREYDCAAGPRPFYVVGHNPNTKKDVLTALGAGANAIEPDVNVYEDRQGLLCISETGKLDKDEGGDSDAPSLAQFLDELHGIARDWPAFALVVFDCKPKVATAAHGVTLLKEIRNRLTFDNDINVIISVGKLSEAAIFDGIKNILGPREGCMIDEENDPTAVASRFINDGVQNRCYGNGNMFQNPVTSPNLRPSIEHACGLRAGRNSFQFIYEWTNNDDDRMREFIRTGVDGIISDDVAKLRKIIREDEFQPLIRCATRADNPFQPPNANYELTVHTGDVHMGGTDANLTFTITGKLGKISKTIDASLDGRMERNDWNFVTIQSPDIGDLVSVTVQRDNDGNAPDWYLDRILVDSFKYGVSKQAVFDRWIDTTSPFTRPLT